MLEKKAFGRLMLVYPTGEQFSSVFIKKNEEGQLLYTCQRCKSATSNQVATCLFQQTWSTLAG